MQVERRGLTQPASGEEGTRGRGEESGLQGIRIHPSHQADAGQPLPGDCCVP